MIYDELREHKTKLAVVGLGYVGLPLAVAFDEEGVDVIGYNRSQGRIDLYKSGVDPTREVGDEKIKKCTVDFTADPERLRECKFIIVAVPTPVDEGHVPDSARSLPRRRSLAGTSRAAVSWCTSRPSTPA